MRVLEVVAAEVPSVSSAVLPIIDEEHRGRSYGSGFRLYGWISDCLGFWHNAALMVASALFVLFLAFQARKSFRKLSHGRSHIMIAYYGFLWLISLLNLSWCFLQGSDFMKMYAVNKIYYGWVACFVGHAAFCQAKAWECTKGKEAPWNVLSLFTTSGMLFLEVSLMAFLLQGNSASGQLEALTRTFVISGLIVGLDILLKAIYLFGFAVPLFIDSIDDTQAKWNILVVHKLILTAVYGFILFLYNSEWKERLPARPAFYNYIIVMFCLNALATLSCGLTGQGAGFGFWLYNATVVCYHALYLPLIYTTFLADFFQEEDLNLENVYYSEMKDAGFFDTDWE